MQNLIKISDAASIAIHSIDYMLKNKKTSYCAKEISKNLDVSYNHLSKVLQRLCKTGFLDTLRGPAGGYKVNEKGKKATLKQILETIEGKKEYSACFLPPALCKKQKCLLKDFIQKTRKELENILTTKISDF